MIEAGSWIALALAVVGIVAEVLRRRWKAQDKKEAEHEQAIHERDNAWNNGDVGGVFNPPTDKPL